MTNAVRAIFWLLISLECFELSRTPISGSILDHVGGDVAEMIIGGILFVLALGTFWHALVLVDKD